MEVSRLRLAAIDIGTNTVRLLVADFDAAGRRHDIARRTSITRLGQGVGESGSFRPEAVVRTLETLGAYADETGRLGVEATRVIATSAARDAADSREFADAARQILDVELEIIDGLTEAELAWLGATADYPFSNPDTPVLVFDVGGGSTELITGSGRRMIAARSLNIGSVRLTEQFVRHDPPTPKEMTAIGRHVAQQVATGLREVKPQLEGLVVIGVAGTVTTIQAVDMQLDTYAPEAIHLSTLTGAAVNRVLELLLSMPLAERSSLPGLEPKRADVIIAGTVITAAVLEAAHADRLTVSESDILDGVLLSLAAEHGVIAGS